MTEKQAQRIEEIRAMHGKYVLLRDKSREEIFLLQGVSDLLEIVDEMRKGPEPKGAKAASKE